MLLRLSRSASKLRFFSNIKLYRNRGFRLSIDGFSFLVYGTALMSSAGNVRPNSTQSQWRATAAHGDSIRWLLSRCRCYQFGPNSFGLMFICGCHEFKLALSSVFTSSCWWCRLWILFLIFHESHAFKLPSFKIFLFSKCKGNSVLLVCFGRD